MKLLGMDYSIGTNEIRPHSIWTSTSADTDSI